MTKIGYEDIRDRIVNRTVEPPHGKLSSKEAWLEGYAQCQLDILDILEELETGE